jgi:hypothetical protein
VGGRRLAARLYAHEKKFVPSTDADGFIDGQIAAILKAMTLWTAAKPAAS